MNRICNFYINDTHLTVTLFEYVKKEITEGTNIIVISQDNMKKSIKDIHQKFRKNIHNSNTNYLKNVNYIKEHNEGKITIIIQGDSKFILNMESEFNELFKNEEVEISIVSCYCITNNNVSEIINNYEKMLNTKGIMNIKENDIQNV